MELDDDALNEDRDLDNLCSEYDTNIEEQYELLNSSRIYIFIINLKKIEI